MKTFSYILLSLLLITSCQKKTTAPVQDFEFEKQANDTFRALMNQLQAQDFMIDNIDPSNYKLSTQWKEIPREKLLEISTIPDAQDRYETGRMRYEATISEDGSNSKLHLEAKIEGYFRAKQGGENVGGGAQWNPEPSNGLAENEIVKSLRAM